MKGPGARDGGDDIKPTLCDPGRDLANAVDIVQQPVLFGEEAPVHEVPAFDAGKGDRELRLGELVGPGGGPLDADGIAFPAGPCHGATLLLRTVLAGQSPVIGPHQIVPFVLRDRGDETLPRIGEDHRGPILIEPVKLLPGQKKDAPKDQGRDPFGMRDRIGQRERGTPRAPEHRPGLHAASLAQAFYVVDEGPGRIVGQRSIGPGLAAAALVEKDDAIDRRIKIPSHTCIDRSARSAVQDERGLSLRIAAFLEIDFVGAAGLHPSGREGFELGIEFASGGIGLGEGHAADVTSR